MLKSIRPGRFKGLLLVGCAVVFGQVQPGAVARPGLAQPAPMPGITIPLADLSAFASPTPNWRIVGSVSADLNKANTLTTGNGTGILANIPADATFGQKYNLMTNFQHGDVDLELDYMMAAKSNSGVYLQGRYEIQLYDSWDVRRPTTVDNGSIYERWDEKRPDGQKGYEGHAPRQNVSRAPGLWQHLKISFLGTALQCGWTENSQRPHDSGRAKRGYDSGGRRTHRPYPLSGFRG